MNTPSTTGCCASSVMPSAPAPATTAPTPGVCNFYTYQSQYGHAAANRLLFGWLSDADARKSLYADMVRTGCPLHFTSQASQKKPVATLLDPALQDYDWADGPRDYKQKAVLLVHPAHVNLALRRNVAFGKHSNTLFANTPYRGLGGFFMLGMDDVAEHDAQRDFADRALAGITRTHFDALATLAFKAGALAPLKSAYFDLAVMAENIALRYVCTLFGFAAKDLALLETCTRKIGRGLQYQNMGRHFVLEPGTMPDCRAAVVQLGQRAAEIMALYSPGAPLTREQALEKEEIDTDLDRLRRTRFKAQTCPHSGGVSHDLTRLQGFVPILQWMAQDPTPPAAPGSDFDMAEKGLIAAGLVGGSVTNIQNAICLVMAQWMKEKDAGLRALKAAAVDLRGKSPDACLDETQALHDRIKEALRVSPPAAFLPRRALVDVDLTKETDIACQSQCGPKDAHRIDKDTLVLLGVGGASWGDVDTASNDFKNALIGTKLNTAPATWGNRTDSYDNAACPFSKVFGGPPDPSPQTGPGARPYTHACPGMRMSMHVIDYAVRQTILLPGLSETLNPATQAPYGLEMRWGQQATMYPLAYDKSKLLAQTPLQTVLPIKAPVAVHAQQLRQVLRLGAPFIEKVLRDANMVHFASFVFLDDDSKLVLFTMYDGDFDNYIEHFALEFGHLFDRFFACVAVQPPMPIRDNPQAFVQYLKQFVQPPVEGYYFSAYPEATTDRVVRHFTPLAMYDLLSITERG